MGGTYEFPRDTGRVLGGVSGLGFDALAQMVVWGRQIRKVTLSGRLPWFNNDDYVKSLNDTVLGLVTEFNLWLATDIAGRPDLPATFDRDHYLRLMVGYLLRTTAEGVSNAAKSGGFTLGKTLALIQALPTPEDLTFHLDDCSARTFTSRQCTDSVMCEEERSAQAAMREAEGRAEASAEVEVGAPDTPPSPAV